MKTGNGWGLERVVRFIVVVVVGGGLNLQYLVHISTKKYSLLIGNSILTGHLMFYLANLLG